MTVEKPEPIRYIPSFHFFSPGDHKIIGQAFVATAFMGINACKLKKTDHPNPSRVDFQGGTSLSFKQNNCARANGVDRS